MVGRGGGARIRDGRVVLHATGQRALHVTSEEEEQQEEQEEQEQEGGHQQQQQQQQQAR